MSAKIAIVAAIVIFMCCCVSMMGSGGGYYYYYTNKKQQEEAIRQVQATKKKEDEKKADEKAAKAAAEAKKKADELAKIEGEFQSKDAVGRTELAQVDLVKYDTENFKNIVFTMEHKTFRTFLGVDSDNGTGVIQTNDVKKAVKMSISKDGRITNVETNSELKATPTITKAGNTIIGLEWVNASSSNTKFDFFRNDTDKNLGTKRLRIGCLDKGTRYYIKFMNDKSIAMVTARNDDQRLEFQINTRLINQGKEVTNTTETGNSKMDKILQDSLNPNNLQPFYVKLRWKDKSQKEYKLFVYERFAYSDEYHKQFGFIRMISKSAYGPEPWLKIHPEKESGFSGTLKFKIEILANIGNTDNHSERNFLINGTHKLDYHYKDGRFDKACGNPDQAFYKDTGANMNKTCCPVSGKHQQELCNRPVFANKTLANDFYIEILTGKYPRFRISENKQQCDELERNNKVYGTRLRWLYCVGPTKRCDGGGNHDPPLQLVLAPGQKQGDIHSEFMVYDALTETDFKQLGEIEKKRYPMYDDHDGRVESTLNVT